MTEHEANKIVDFLANSLLSNDEMIALCNGLKIANDDVTDENKNFVWWNAQGHLERAEADEFSNQFRPHARSI